MSSSGGRRVSRHRSSGGRDPPSREREQPSSRGRSSGRPTGRSRRRQHHYEDDTTIDDSDDDSGIILEEQEEEEEEEDSDATPPLRSSSSRRSAARHYESDYTDDDRRERSSNRNVRSSRHHHHHRHSSSDHQHRSSPRQRRRHERHHDPDPLISPEILSSLSTSVTASLQSGFTQTVQLVKTASTAASCTIQEASKSLPSSEEVSDKARMLLGSPLAGQADGDAGGGDGNGATAGVQNHQERGNIDDIVDRAIAGGGGGVAGGAGIAGGGGAGAGGGYQHHQHHHHHHQLAQNYHRDVEPQNVSADNIQVREMDTSNNSGSGSNVLPSQNMCLSVPAINAAMNTITLRHTTPTKAQCGGGGGRPPPSPERIIYPDISADADEVAADSLDDYVNEDGEFVGVEDAGAIAGNTGDNSVANLSMTNSANESMLLGENLLNTNTSRCSGNSAVEAAARSPSPTPPPPTNVSVMPMKMGARSISPPPTTRVASPITAPITECVLEEESSTENSILATSEENVMINDDGNDNEPAATSLLQQVDALQTKVESFGGGGKGIRSVDDYEEGDIGEEVEYGVKVMAHKSVLHVSSETHSGDEDQVVEQQQQQQQQQEEEEEEDKDDPRTNNEAVTKGPDAEDESEHGRPNSVVQHLRIISNLRLQLDSLQQTATLAQRGWDDARATLERERSETAKLREEMDLLKEENISLKDNNAKLQKITEREDREWEKLQAENESLKAELFESEQELVKQRAGSGLRIVRSLSYENPKKQQQATISMPTNPTHSSVSEDDRAKPADPLPPLSPARSASSSHGVDEILSPISASSFSVPSLSSSEQTKARIRAERKARKMNNRLPSDRARSRPSRGRGSSAEGNPKFSAHTAEDGLGWTDGDGRTPLHPQPTLGEIVDLPSSEPQDISTTPKKASSAAQVMSTLTPRRTVSEKEPKAPASLSTPSTAAMTPSPESQQRKSPQLQVGGEPSCGGEAGGESSAWESVRIAPLRILKPPRLLPDDLSKSPGAHVVFKYHGPRLSLSDGDFAESQFDAAYLDLEDANHRARYVFFVLNAMGQEVEDLLDDPSVMVSTTDGDVGAKPWGERLKLTYRYKDWDGRKMIWKVWVVPAAQDAPPGRDRTRSKDSTVRTVTKQGPDGPTVRMLV